MYKSKKQNYPGLYGTFKKIDNQNLPQEPEPDAQDEEPARLADYGSDDDFQDLDRLIHNLKKKAKGIPPEGPVPTVTKQTEPSIEQSTEEISIEEELEQLKKAQSFFSSKSRGQMHSATPVVIQDDESVTDLFTDDSYLDSLEEDLFDEKERTAPSRKEPEPDPRTLEHFEHLTEELLVLLQSSTLKNRERFTGTSLFSQLLSELETMKDEG